MSHSIEGQKVCHVCGRVLAGYRPLAALAHIRECHQRRASLRHVANERRTPPAKSGAEQ